MNKRALSITVSAVIILALILTVFGCTQTTPTPTPTPKPTSTATPTPSPTTTAPAYTKASLKVSSFLTAPPALMSMPVQWFMEEVTAKTGGAVTFTPYWGGALAPAMEHLDTIGKGVADIGVAPWSYWPGKLPLGGIEMAFPFAPSDPQLMTDLKWQLYKEFPQFNAEMTASNVKVLQFTPVTDHDLMSSIPINKIEDLKGKKIGVLGGYFGDWVGAVGAVPVSSGAGERYLQLKDRVIDDSLLSADMAFGFKHYEVAKYYIETTFGARVTVNLVINIDAWNKLNPATQQVLLDVSKAAEKKYIDELVKTRPDYLKKLTEQGVTVTKLPQAEIEKWAKLVPNTPAKWANDMEAKGLPGKQIVKRFLELAVQKGHKWPADFASGL